MKVKKISNEARIIKSLLFVEDFYYLNLAKNIICIMKLHTTYI